DKKGAASTSLEQARRDIARKIVARERGTQWLTEAEKALAMPAGPEKAAKINTLVNEAGLKWESTGSFDAGSQMIPKIGNVEGLTAAAFALSKDQPYPTQLFRNGPKGYVIRFKNVTEDKGQAKPDEAAEQISRSRAQDALSSWEKKLAEKARIHRNLDLVAEQ
ncbi:MAG TPA: hypothetical protein VFV50_13650, partial [Bdellovibrionales bacterium]|nr:hypothetical protein [Bdellovibrionales bacterium]